MKPLPTAHNIIKWLADPADILGEYYHKTQQLKELNTLWQQQMDPTLARHTCVANFTDTQLIIEINTSAWASRMHYIAPDVLQQVRQWPLLQTIQSVNWYIRPPNAIIPTTPNQGHTPLLSDQNKQLLSATAENITSTELKQALLNLSKVKIGDQQN